MDRNGGKNSLAVRFGRAGIETGSAFYVLWMGLRRPAGQTAPSAR